MPDLKITELPSVSSIAETSVFAVAADILGSFQSSQINLEDLRVQILGGSTFTLEDILNNGNTSGGVQIDMEGVNIVELADPVNPQDAATKNYVDTSPGVPQDLESVLGEGNSAGANDIDMNGNDILSVNNIVGGAILGVGATDVGIDATDVLTLIGSSSISVLTPQMDMAGTITMNGNEITGLPLIPTLPDSAASKQYVDNAIGVSQDLDSVLSNGNSAGANDIDLNNNTLDNVGALGRLSGIGTFDIQNLGNINSNQAFNILVPQFTINAGGGAINLFNGTINFANQISDNVPLPTEPDQVANKQYVDSVLSSNVFVNRSPAGNFQNNPWQNGTDLNNIGFPNSAVRLADRFFFERIGNAPLTSVCEVDRVNPPDFNLLQSPSNVAMRIESDTVVSHASNTYEILSTRVNGLDSAGMEGVNVGFIIVSFSISAQIGSEGIYGLSIFHPNGGSALSYVVEVEVTNDTTFKSFSIPTPPVDFPNTITGDSSESIRIALCLGAGSNYVTTPNSWQSGNSLTTANQVNLFDATSNRFYIGDFSVCVSNTNSPLLHPLDVAPLSRNQVVDHCHSYYQKSHLNGVMPFSTLTTSGAVFVRNETGSTAAGSIYYNHKFSTEFIRTPSVTFINPTNNTSSEWGINPFPGVGTALPTDLVYTSTKGFTVTNSFPGAGASSPTYTLHWVFDAGI